MAQSLETLRSNNVTPIFGRRLGLQHDETLAGPKGLKLAIEDISSTNAQTILNYGITRITGLGSAQGPVQHTLPPPIPGIEKVIANQTTSTGSYQFLTSGCAVIASSDGSSKAVVNLAGPGGSITLIGLTSAYWGVKARDGSSAASLPIYTTST